MTTAQTKAIWLEWNALDDDNASPVRTIAAKLGLTTAAVAAVVYPVDRFGAWDDGDEPPTLAVFRPGGGDPAGAP
jgi:hypothetical protein